MIVLIMTGNYKMYALAPDAICCIRSSVLKVGQPRCQLGARGVKLCNLQADLGGAYMLLLLLMQSSKLKSIVIIRIAAYRDSQPKPTVDYVIYGQPLDKNLV